MKKIVLSSILIFLSLFSFAEETLSNETVKKLNSSVFEIVVEKNEKDSFTYEKPLPYDKLPFIERTSKYDSIGTAFLMKDGNFYTAYHVFNFMFKALHGDFYIRKSDQSVYKVDKILKFSADRDFAIFTVKDFSADKDAGLEFEENLELNSEVYAVGNAQGEGVIIRNGLFTSETPEDRDGEWKWLRFSAAASPGNSGGPLVTKDGKVAGVITMKNGSENLNYALPAKEIKNVKDNTGVYHLRHIYGIANIENLRDPFDLDFVLDLPAEISEVSRISYEKYYEITNREFDSLKAKYGTKGTECLTEKDPGCPYLNQTISVGFPSLLCRATNGKWNGYVSNKVENVNLEDNGELKYGGLGGFIFIKYKMHDGDNIQNILENPGTVMDEIVQHYGLSRNMAGEKIAVTSLGNPVRSYDHTDVHGRKWIVDMWDITFAGAAGSGIICYKIPVPDGIIIFMKIAPYSTIYSGLILDMNFLTDYIVLPYTGKISQWKNYLSLDESLYPRHELLKDYSLTSDKKKISFDSKIFSAEIPEKVLKIEDEDFMELSLRFAADSEKGFRIDITGFGLFIDENENSQTDLVFTKAFAPHKKASKDLKDQWKIMETKSMPFSGAVVEKGNDASIVKILKSEEDSICYMLINKSIMKKKELKKDFEKIQKCIKIK